MENTASTSSTPMGRPLLSFAAASERSKRRKTETLRSSYDVKELSVATSMTFRAEGNKPAAKLIQEITSNSAEHARKILNTWKKRDEKIKQVYTPEEALCFLVGNNITKKQYEAMYTGAKIRNFDLYPSYKKLLKAKKAAYPPDITISTITEKMCEISLQSLLDHTCSRLLHVLQLSNEDYAQENNYLMICKYGFDGSSGHSNYKQSWSEENINDQSLFLTIVPLQLQTVETQQLIWTNPRPASTRFCRPIRLQWRHESDEISKLEKEIMDKQRV